jgi:hypothetical protein
MDQIVVDIDTAVPEPAAAPIQADPQAQPQAQAE